MELNKLGNKSGIAGIILAALGLGGGTFSGEIARELAPPAPYVSYEQRQANETLLAAVDRLAQVITSGEQITTQIKDNVEMIRKRAAETAQQVATDTQAEVLQTRDEVVATVRESIRAVVVKAASGLAGIVGVFLSAAGFRSGTPTSGGPTRKAAASGDTTREGAA